MASRVRLKLKICSIMLAALSLPGANTLAAAQAPGPEPAKSTLKPLKLAQGELNDPHGVPQTELPVPALKPQLPLEGQTTTMEAKDELRQDFRDVDMSGNSDEAPLKLPKADLLLPIGGGLPLIKLEASFNQALTLREALVYTLRNNLPINIQKQEVSQQGWLFTSALGGFLPNSIMTYRQQILQGTTFIGGVIPVSFHTPNIQMTAGFQAFGFQGGRILFGSLAAMHNWKAARANLRATISDVLLLVTQQYYDLVRQQALLEIQVKAVEVSRAQVDLNEKLERAGTGTRFAILQSETQLASDEQNLLQQEVAFRNAAIRLANTLNLNLGINLLPVETAVRRRRIVEPALNINDLMKLAIDYRPELKQFEELRLAARRQIQVAAAPLYPNFQFFGNINGSGATLSKTYQLSRAQLKVVPITGPAPAGSAINPPPNSSPPILPAGTVLQAAQMGPRQVAPSYSLGIGVDWNQTGLGAPAAAASMAARANARQALLQANQELLNVLTEVRTAYLVSLIAEREIDVTTKAVASSSEQLRLSRVRLANGVGTNLDVIAAQRAWTQALTSKADAILKFNVAQAQLLRNVGLMGVEHVVSGKLVGKTALPDPFRVKQLQ